MSAAIPPRAASLRIVAVNDVYSLDELPRLASLIAEARRVDPPDRLLITVAGDFLAPSLLSSLDQGRGMVDCLNALGVTHVTLGNHEDDLDTEDLFARLEELDALVVLSNAPDFRGRHVSEDVVLVGPHRVGLVGVVNGDPGLYRRAPFGGATVEEPNEAAVRTARVLRGAGCVAVVALTHQWLEDDRELAGLGVVDLVLGGHEHEGYLETNHRAPIAKAKVDATAAVVADLVLAAQRAPTAQPASAGGGALEPADAAHVDVSVHVRSVPVAPYPEDTAMRARVDRHLEQVRSLRARTLMQLPAGTVLSSLGSRLHQTSMGTLVASRLRDALGAEVGLFNGGGLRGDEERRERLTYADFCEELPFENEAVVATLPGAVVRDALLFSRTERHSTGGFLQVDDATEVDDRHVLRALAGAPLDPQRLYRVAIVRDLLVGSDNIEPFVDYWRAHPGAVPPATTGLDVKVALLRTFTGGALHGSN
ncbi:MAG: bifunctional metallophosphatase/5'-nucleotidase [Sandaracinaceae bacterium]|nr:bifunctional metallophosphatase/5'-nucleotidase [Sandaracinaceae bacterium]